MAEQQNGGVRMAMITLTGQIGTSPNMVPQEFRSHTGKTIRKCIMLSQDLFGEIQKDEEGNVIMRNGRPQRKRKDYTLLFSADDSQKAVFDKLVPGMRILVTGHLRSNPRAGEYNGRETNKYIFKDKETGKCYEGWDNLEIKVSNLEFLDAPVKQSVEFYLGLAVRAGKLEMSAAKELADVIVREAYKRNTARRAETQQEKKPVYTSSDDDPFK